MKKFFNKNLTCADYRAKAKELCDKQVNKLLVIMLVYLVISVAVVIIDNLTGNKQELATGAVVNTTWFRSVFNLLTTGAFSLSFIEIAKNVYLEIEVKTDDLFQGFKKFWKGFTVYLLQSLYTVLWSLLFVIPGIIKSFSYSMAMYIANDNKELSANECITKSRELMNGHKFELFMLMLSYIGWIILCVLTLGILTLWVVPRINQATYLFYLKISGIGERYENSLEEALNEGAL